jgi:hypothetical protein
MKARVLRVWMTALGIGLVGTVYAQAPAVPGSGVDSKQIGTLTCTASAPSTDPQLPPQQETQFACTFEPIGAEGVKEYYVGSSSERLRDVGPTGKTLMAWSVHTAGKSAAPGSLEGTYSPTPGGPGGNNLTGGVQNAFTLQPLTVPDQAGPSAALDSFMLRRDRPRV